MKTKGYVIRDNGRYIGIPNGWPQHVPLADAYVYPSARKAHDANGMTLCHAGTVITLAAAKRHEKYDARVW